MPNYSIVVGPRYKIGDTLVQKKNSQWNDLLIPPGHEKKLRIESVLFSVANKSYCYKLTYDDYDYSIFKTEEELEGLLELETPRPRKIIRFTSKFVVGNWMLINCQTSRIVDVLFNVKTEQVEYVVKQFYCNYWYTEDILEHLKPWEPRFTRGSRVTIREDLGGLEAIPGDFPITDSIVSLQGKTGTVVDIEDMPGRFYYVVDFPEIQQPENDNTWDFITDWMLE